ncbi:MAG: asparagine synthase (glutamine-hydrolyzing) [Anaerolinea sp.]|nr:asparagine synthase (glutamine-hydrolyzing) [Anaerolinea sp.]
MCGIAGWLGTVLDGQNVITEMMQRLDHRGPDDNGSMLWDSAMLLQTRLSIIDLAPTGKQPMCNEDGTIWTVFNGEIYNHHDLRAELEAKGHQFRGRSDTEVLPHLYEEEGGGFIHKLRGMFAFAIFDTRRQIMIVARDRFGIKPLFYTLTAKRFGFASEIRALRALPEINLKPNAQAVADFAALFYIPAPDTFFTGISALLPGEMIELCFDATGIASQKRQYHRWDISPDEGLTFEAAVARAEALTDAAVHRQLESDVPLGTMLSGGIDSSLVSSAAQVALKQPLNTFNVRFADAEYDETWAAVEVAQHIGSRHHTLDVNNAQGNWEYITEMLMHVGQPFADTSIFAVDNVSRLIRQHVTVALSGDGGDEGFGGYKAYGRVNRLAQFQHLPGWMWQNTGNLAADVLQIAAQLGAAPQHLAARMRDLALSNDSTYFVQKMFCVLPEAEHRRLIRDIDAQPIRRLFEPEITRGKRYTNRAEQLSAQIAEASLRIEMPNAFLFKTDIASMHRSLEVRVPMLDEDLFAFGLALPHRLKVYQGQTKAVLRQVAARRLPARIANKPKHGFSIPVDTWVDAEFKARLRETLLGSNSNLPRFFAPDSYRPIIEAFVNRRTLPGVALSLLYRRAIMLLSIHLAAI